MTTWLELLQTAVKNTSITKVAKELGYSRTAVSLALSGNYAGSTQRIADKVMAVYGTVSCPYLGVVISSVDCQKHHQQHPPTHNPERMRHWKTCQGCTHNKQGACHE